MKKIALMLAGVGLVLSMAAQAKSTKEISEYPLGERGLFSERATIERINMAGTVCYEGDACAAAAAPAVAAGPRTGDEIVSAVCGGCHVAGVMGAPVIGNKAQWAPRIAQGVATLHKHGIEGIRSMPPKGGCGTCSDDEIIAAVDVMIAKSK
ncbi:MAG: c-type cytochrome [Paraperlucidibaca sp.]